MNENIKFSCDPSLTAKYISVLRALRGFITVLSILLLPVSAHALSCETDLSKFDFMETSAFKENRGTRDQVTYAYDVLANNIGELDSYPNTTIFYIRSLGQIAEFRCPKERCTGTDISYTGMLDCQRIVDNKQLTCLPLAAVYNGKLYCLLQPSLKPGEPYREYVPFSPENQSHGG
tara:strand:+ start:1269 stop:1796 length:528 start_codon:yes stop_codon:yes gene_type:complete